MNDKVLKMSFGGVYKALVEKVQRKGMSENEVDEITSWINLS